jgi:aminoglycoside phosphotransferase (APT) family kinase protein
VAREAGIRVPALLAFDDSRELVDRPYSIWERVHGETLGLFAPDPTAVASTWCEVGRELGRLHLRVRECPDPRGWLDRPGRDRQLDERAGRLEAAGRLSTDDVATVGRWTERLRPALDEPVEDRFLHDDGHAMNVMCSRDGALLALLDWGDAGWGDPALDLARVPLAALPAVLEGHGEVAPGILGNAAPARLLWDRIESALEDLEGGYGRPGTLADLARFVESDERWRRALA